MKRLTMILSTIAAALTVCDCSNATITSWPYTPTSAQIVNAGGVTANALGVNNFSGFTSTLPLLAIPFGTNGSYYTQTLRDGDGWAEANTYYQIFIGLTNADGPYYNTTVGLSSSSDGINWSSNCPAVITTNMIPGCGAIISPSAYLSVDGTRHFYVSYVSNNTDYYLTGGTKAQIAHFTVASGLDLTMSSNYILDTTNFPFGFPLENIETNVGVYAGKLIKAGDGNYYLFYSAGTGSGGGQVQLAAQSSSPYGPFTKLHYQILPNGFSVTAEEFNPLQMKDGSWVSFTDGDYSQPNLGNYIWLSTNNTPTNGWKLIGQFPFPNPPSWAAGHMISSWNIPLKDGRIAFFFGNHGQGVSHDTPQIGEFLLTLNPSSIFTVGNYSWNARVISVGDMTNNSYAQYDREHYTFSGSGDGLLELMYGGLLSIGRHPGSDLHPTNYVAELIGRPLRIGGYGSGQYNANLYLASESAATAPVNGVNVYDDGVVQNVEGYSAVRINVGTQTLSAGGHTQTKPTQVYVDSSSMWLSNVLKVVSRTTAPSQDVLNSQMWNSNNHGFYVEGTNGTSTLWINIP